MAGGQGDSWMSFRRGRRRGEEEKREGCLGADPRPRQAKPGEENSCLSYPDYLNFVGFCLSYSPTYGTGGVSVGGGGGNSDFMKSILITFCNPQHSVITRLLYSSTKKLTEKATLSLRAET